MGNKPYHYHYNRDVSLVDFKSEQIAFLKSLPENSYKYSLFEFGVIVELKLHDYQFRVEFTVERSHSYVGFQPHPPRTSPTDYRFYRPRTHLSYSYASEFLEEFDTYLNRIMEIGAIIEDYSKIFDGLLIRVPQPSSEIE